jgi:outer membrane protein TolC
VSKLRQILLFLLFISATFGAAEAQHSPALPDAPWQPPHSLFGNKPVPLYRHEAVLKESDAYTLGQLIDIAEENNPSTHAAWDRARVAASSLGIARSELYPTVLASAAGRTFLEPPLLYRTLGSLSRLSLSTTHWSTLEREGMKFLQPRLVCSQPISASTTNTLF